MFGKAKGPRKNVDKLDTFTRMSQIMDSFISRRYLKKNKSFSVNSMTSSGSCKQMVRRPEVTLKQTWSLTDVEASKEEKDSRTKAAQTCLPSTQSLTNLSIDIQLKSSKPLMDFKTKDNISKSSSPPKSTSNSINNNSSRSQRSPRVSGIAPIQDTNSFNYEKYREYKHLAELANKEQKVFTIIGGYQAVRSALLQRGWRERLWDNQHQHLQKTSQHSLLLNAKPNNEYEMAAISHLLQPYNSNFIWYPKYMRMNRFDSVEPFKSRLIRSRDFDFSIKCALVNIARNSHWHFISGKSELVCPRSYRMFMQEEVDEFRDDFRFTGCTSLLLYVVDGQKENGTNDRFSSSGTVPTVCIDFAIKRIREQIRVQNHDDIDGFRPERLESVHWRTFFADYHATVRLGAKFKMPPDVRSLIKTCRELLASVRNHWPNVDTDGHRNIWIVKPAGSSRGIGVNVMENNLTIIDFINQNPRKRYIVQKYLERPLLIYNTKFDIRQYFLLVGRANSLQVWMYKVCYLKFSSQEFSLKNFHESVHLTNHCVQRNYENAQHRSSLLPVCNMWSSDEFCTYLDTIDQPKAWTHKIYPSMKRSIVAIVRATYEEGADIEPKCFELFGADFIITEAMDSQLLEVNATPDMKHSTPVTSVICPQCLDDVVKVVVDRATNRNAFTGNFELIYEIAQQRVHPHVSGLSVTGSTPKVLQKPVKVYSSFDSSNIRQISHISSKSNTPPIKDNAKRIPLVRPATAPKLVKTIRPVTEQKRSVSLSPINKQRRQEDPTPKYSSRKNAIDVQLKRTLPTSRRKSPANLEIVKSSPPATTVLPNMSLIKVQNCVVPNTCQEGISKEVTRLMTLNHTIERLLTQNQSLTAH